MEYPFTTINPRSTLTQSRKTELGQIELFEI